MGPMGSREAQIDGIALSAAGLAVVYVLQCRDDSLYTGWTNDLARRLAAHRRGIGSRYTRARLPIRLFALWSLPNRGAALRFEAAFKRLARSEKLALIAGDERSARGDILLGARRLHLAPEMRGKKGLRRRREA